ncbi:hypothetical protein P4S73_29285 [Paraglaciecola sp. Hal342]
MDAGWGTIVEDCKINDHFSDELVDAVVEMIEQRWNPELTPSWVCCVPSLRQTRLVPDFANRLANKLGIPFLTKSRKLSKQNRKGIKEIAIINVQILTVHFK